MRILESMLGHFRIEKETNFSDCIAQYIYDRYIVTNTRTGSVTLYNSEWYTRKQVIDFVTKLHKESE
jgi:hypothetical protein